jgi:hypothetical protein
VLVDVFGGDVGVDNLCLLVISSERGEICALTPITIVGTITKAKEAFLYTTTPKLPNAGAVAYWPRYLNPIAGGTMKRKPDRQDNTARLLGKSCGFSISEMKVGNRICGTQRNVMLSTAFIAATKVVPAGGKAYVFTSPALG